MRLFHRTDNTPQARYATNIPRYFLYLGLRGFGFGLFVATWFVYMKEVRGLTLAQAASIDATYFLIVALAEVPTGLVADKLGRKISILTGGTLVWMGMLGWVLAPTLPLVIIAYMAMGIGITFQSGAEDAFFYESLQSSGRGHEYGQWVGKATATFPATFALGSLLGGFLASLELGLPYLVSGVILFLSSLAAFGFYDPAQAVNDPSPKSFRQIFGQSFGLMRRLPSVRYPMLYMVILPLAPFMLEGIFMQPQALEMGLPLASLGILLTVSQLLSTSAMYFSRRIADRIGEERLLYLTPLAILSCLLLLARFQIPPGLVFIMIASFFSAVLRPIMLNRIQGLVANEIRATLLSFQSLLFSFMAAIMQVSMTSIGDVYGLPRAYLSLALVVSLLVVGLFWISHPYFSLKPPVMLEADA